MNNKILMNAALAGLMSAGALSMVSRAFAEEGAAAPTGNAPKGHCMGANTCKGQGGCKAVKGNDKHDCAGKNSCKGKSFTETTKDECTTKKWKANS